MSSMRSTVALLALVAGACATSTTAPTTSVASTVTTDTRPPVTTTAPTQDYQVQNCATPPVMFVPLCEMWELLEDWHVDRPLDPTVLADLAVEGLLEFETEETEPPPRTLFCAVPHDAFRSSVSSSPRKCSHVRSRWRRRSKRQRHTWSTLVWDPSPTMCPPTNVTPSASTALSEA